MEANSRSGIHHEALQRKLDWLDWYIYELERSKAETGDPDLPQDIEEAKHFQQAARESYSKGELLTAWGQAIRAEMSVSQGWTENESWNEVNAALGEMLKAARL